jgi:hypothetical protein
MKPRIVLIHHRYGSVSDQLDIFHDGELLETVYDADYEDCSASSACRLLAAMHKKGLIDLYADPSAFALWSESLADCELVEDPKDVLKK